MNSRLYELRRRERLTQGELAWKAGLTQPAISGYESGKVQMSVRALLALAKVFNCSAEYLAGVDEETKPEPPSPEPPSPEPPNFNSLWRNNKTGNDYRVLGIAARTEENYQLVIYYPVDDPLTSKWWARPLDMWHKKFTHLEG